MTLNSMQKTKICLLCVSALAGFTVFQINAAHAADVTFSGDNAVMANGCSVAPTPPALTGSVPITIPSSCPGATFTPLVPFSAPSHAFPSTLNDAVIVGTNLSNSNTGPGALGGVLITNGGRVDSSQIYAGLEFGSEGVVTINGPGSIWVNTNKGVLGAYGIGGLDVTDGAKYEQTTRDHFTLGYYQGGQGYALISGVDAVTGDRSTISLQDGFYAGRGGYGEIIISDGGLLTAAQSSSVAGTTTGRGRVTVTGVNAVTGDRSTLQILNRQLWVGSSGPANHGTSGVLHVLDGGWVDVQDALSADGNYAEVLISGVNADTGIRSSMTGMSLHAGDFENGIVNVRDGAIVEVNFAAMAIKQGYGQFTVDGVNATTGDRSTLITTTSIYAGQEGTGVFTASNGAFVHSKLNLSTGDVFGGTGIVNIGDSGTEVIVDAIARIGRDGDGTLNLYDNATLSAAQVLVAANAGSEGVLNIGAGGEVGTLNAPVVEGGLGDATLNFNHTDTTDFNARITANIDVNHVNAGTTTLNGANDYLGLTTVSAGTLQAGAANRFSIASSHIVQNGGTLSLNGYGQTLSHIENAGTLRFGGLGGTQLSVTGDYIGQGGVVELNAVLHDDSSVTDKMIVNNTSGTSFIKVSNRNGQGAQTIQGIELINVTNNSNGVFTLAGDYVHDGASAVVAGAYAYKLYKGTDGNPADGNWYLRSDYDPNLFKPVLYQAGVPSYEVYAQSLLSLNGLGTMQQRIDQRTWASSAVASTSETGLSGSADSSVRYSVPQIETTDAWFRTEGVHNNIKPHHSVSRTEYHQNIIKMQAGVDHVLSIHDNGMVVGGAYLQYTHGKTETNSGHGDGEVSTNGYGVGGTLTWYDDDGFYVDGQAQVNMYRSDLSSKLTKAALVSGNDALGYALSVEGGENIALTSDVAITPQAQIVYSDVSFDGFEDAFGAKVKSRKDESLQTRVGFSLDLNKPTQDGFQHVYGVANVYYELLNGSKVDVSGTSLASKQDRVWGGVGVGGTHSWGNGNYSVFGETQVKTSLQNFGDSYSVQGTVGVRLKW